MLYSQRIGGMQMLLRRVIAHVRKQEWTAIAIDFVIVVVGVFVGLQVNNWNEARSERQRETLILQNIATDLRSDIDGYSDAIDGSLDKIAAVSYLLDNANLPPGRDLTDDFGVSRFRYDDVVETAVQGGAQSLDERTANFDDELWSLAVQVANAQPSTTAFDSLVSAGELGTLRDESVVRSLQEYRQFTAALVKAQEVTYRPSRDRMIGVGQDFGLSLSRGVDKKGLVALMSDNPKLAATVQTELVWAKGHLTMLGGASNLAEQLLRQIEGTADENPKAEAK